jgi:hypothetical protein
LLQGSSFFPPFLLEHKVYRVGQKLTALVALSQFIAVGGVSAAAACLGLFRSIVGDLRWLVFTADEHGAAAGGGGGGGVGATGAAAGAGGGGFGAGEEGEEEVSRRWSLLAVRVCMLVPTLAFFAVVPLVQIPLLKVFLACAMCPCLH